MEKTINIDRIKFVSPLKLATVFVHYGADHYDVSRFKTVQNSEWAKPKHGTGYWMSPIDSEFGWKDWCKAEDFRECREGNSVRLKFREGSKIVVIDSYKDLDSLPHHSGRHGSILFSEYPDFETISEFADAIWLTEKGQLETRTSQPKTLYGWDCESVLVINPNSIAETKHY